MNTSSITVGILSSLLFVSACASGGATSTAESRREASLATADGQSTIVRRTCSSSNTSVAPADGMLADFDAKLGRIVTSVAPGAPATTTLTHTTNGGKLTLNVNAVPADKPQFLVADMPFDGCVDASGFAGVEFSISGSLSGCSLVFASVDPEHQYYRTEGPYPPQSPIPTAELTSQPRTIKAPFRGAAIAGNPATPTDASKLAFVQWLVIVPVGSGDGSAVPACIGTLAIDDVKLYR
jgi:hypothetical protein